MLERGSLKTPVILGIVLIILVVVLGAIWGITSFFDQRGVAFWTLFVAGSLLLIGISGPA